MLTDRDTRVVASVAHYYTLTRAQINRLHFPEDDDGRLTRRRLQVLLDAKLIHRTTMQVVNPAQGAPAPVYYPSREGCAFAAQETGDERLRSACCLTPTWQNLYHWVRVAETHILADRAVHHVGGVTIPEWYGEWSVVNAEERTPEKRYRLYTRLTERIVCVPDAAFLLEKGSHRKAFYLEQDRDTTKNAERVAAQKHTGYSLMVQQGGHRKHFPSANVPDFTVLAIAPTERRREALRKAFATQLGAKLWKFASLTDLRAETLLMAPVWHACDGTASSLIRTEGGAA